MSSSHVETRFKQVLVMRRGDIKMRTGKIASQAAHASHLALTQGSGARFQEGDAGTELVIPLDPAAYAWLTGNYRKVCVYVTNEAALLEVYRQAQEAGLRCALVQDSGLTEFKGVSTYTAVAIGPHEDARIDLITGELPLL